MIAAAALLEGDAVDVAPRLLGLRLETADAAGRIVEVEAYGGDDDPASHAAGGPRVRNRSMFGPAGTLYVYRSYGLHWCANVVTGPLGVGQAVLVRAVEPLGDLTAMRARRPGVRDRHLADGPGKLCAALGITGDDDGASVLDGAAPVRLVDDGTAPPVRPLVGPRVGIRRAVDRPWRWAVPDSPFVSRPRPAAS